MITPRFPLKLNFHIGTLANDFIITDSYENLIFFARQKIMKLTMEVEVFSDSQKTNLLYGIKANKIIDFNAAYTITGNLGNVIGSVARKGWASLWNAHYTIFDTTGAMIYEIREADPWVKFWDGVIKQIPLLGLFSGYMFHPEYLVTDLRTGTKILSLKKQSAFMGNLFEVNQLGQYNSEHNELLLLSLSTMILMERHRG